MATPTPVGTAAVTVDTSGSTSTSASLPAGIQVGEVLRMAVVGSLPVIPPDVAASGWTTQQESLFTNGTGHGVLLKRIADGSEGSTIAVTSANAEHRVVIIWRETGWDTGTPEEIAVFIGTTSPFSIDPPSLTPSWDATTIPTLFYAIGFQDATAAEITSVPSGYTEIGTDRTATLQGGAVSVAYKVVTTASEDPGTFGVDSTGSRTLAFTVAVAGVVDTGLSVAGSSTLTGDVTALGIGMNDLVGSIPSTSLLELEVLGNNALGLGGSIEPTGQLDQSSTADFAGSIGMSGGITSLDIPSILSGLRKSSYWWLRRRKR